MPAGSYYPANRHLNSGPEAKLLVWRHNGALKNTALMVSI